MEYVAIAAFLGGTAASVQSSRNAAKATEIQYKEQAKDEELAARDREIERRRSLVQALASQNAEGGAAGLDQTVGSRRAISLEDARRARMDSLTDRARTNRRASLLRSSARNARRQGDLEAAGTLLDATSTIARGYAG